METVALITGILENNKIALTPPQAEIADMLKRGYLLINVNTHRMSGGEYMWIHQDNIDTITHAGSVYKAFWGLHRKIEKFLPNQNVSPFISPIRNIRYN